MKFLLQTQIGVEKIAELELEEKFKGQYSLDYTGFVPHKNGLIQLDWRSEENLDFYKSLGTVEDAFFVLDYVKDLNIELDAKGVVKKLDLKGLKSELDYFFDKLNPFDKTKSFRFVTRKKSPHEFRRMDLNKEIKGFFETLVKRVDVTDEEDKKEIWTTLIKNRLIVAVRLTNRDKRHGYYKVARVHGSLRPTIAYSLAYISEIRSKDTIWDPFCGAGTIPCEICENFKFKKLIASDINSEAIEATKQNLNSTNSFNKLKGKVSVRLEDFFESNNYGDLVITNLPFGKQYNLNPDFMADFFNKLDQVKNLRQVTILFINTIEVPGWQMTRRFELQVLGQDCYAMVFRKVKG